MKVFVRYLFLSLLFLTVFPVSSFSQKKQITQAQDMVKSGKDLDKAESMMRKLLQDSVGRSNKRVWLTLVSALTGQYEQGNEKLYLKQKYDTTALFSITKRLFEDMQAFDSIDAQPDKKGRVAPRYRERHSEYLNRIRANLYYGGAYYIRRGDYAKAQNFLETYVACKDMPLFSGYDYATTDTLMPSAAYWIMYCGNKVKDADLVLSYESIARKESLHRDFMLQYVSEAYLMKNDTANYVRTLHEGLDYNALFPFFFPRLVEYYNSKDMFDKAMGVVDQAMLTDSANVTFRSAKSTILLNQRKYDECIKLSEELIAENESLADAYYNIGLAYFDQAIEMDKVKQKYKTKRQKMTKLYEKSLPYMERYRQLAPSQVRRWSLPLYTIYLNLNKGKEFDEIDKIRNEYRRKHQ